MNTYYKFIPLLIVLAVIISCGHSDDRDDLRRLEKEQLEGTRIDTIYINKEIYK